MAEMDAMRAARRRQQRILAAGIIGFWLAFAVAVLLLLMHPEVVGAWLNRLIVAARGGL